MAQKVAADTPSMVNFQYNTGYSHKKELLDRTNTSALVLKVSMTQAIHDYGLSQFFIFFLFHFWEAAETVV